MPAGLGEFRRGGSDPALQAGCASTLPSKTEPAQAVSGGGLGFCV